MENDLNAILAYLERRHRQNPYFYYDVKGSPKDQMMNFLWVNGKSRLWYDYFNDIVIFDSNQSFYSFKYNKHVTLAPFLGINHHFQFIILGWALLLDPSEESLVWLFDSWLRSMHGQQPVTIITNPSSAVTNAVKTVLPNTRHRLSLWHMKKSFKNQIAKLNNKQTLKKEFKRCITNLIVERFERDWAKMVQDYGLGEFEWVSELYQTRVSWAPAYNHTAFAAGLHTTYFKEGLSCFLDNIWRFHNLRLYRVVIKCERAIMDQYRSERKNDHNSTKKPKLILRSFLEAHASLLYTPMLFEMFQEELIDSTGCIVKRVEKNESVHKYEVINPFVMTQEPWYVVTLDMSSNIGSCECKWYEYMGMLCSHMLVVLHRKNVLQIPSHFIMERWTKKANKGGRFSLRVDPADPDAPSLRRSAVYRCMNYCRCLAKQSDVLEVTYHDYVNILVRDLGSLQFPFRAVDEIDCDGNDDEDSDYSDYSEVSEPIGEEDVEYIASMAERSADVYETIVKSLEELMTDLNMNQTHQNSEDYSHSEDMGDSDSSESVEGGLFDDGGFWGGCSSSQSKMQVDQKGESVEPDESDKSVRSHSGTKSESDSDSTGRSSKSNQA